jgi:FlaA1/EpsC-like NDP-sugar epimerase
MSRKQYKLNDGSSYNVLEAMEEMLKRHGEKASESLMQQRLITSTDPSYIFMAKNEKIEGGHPYSNENMKRKKAKLNKTSDDDFIEAVSSLSPADLILKNAFIAAGISWR